MFLLAGALSWVSPAAEATVTILRVDKDANTGGNGSSWGSAFKYLQDAIDAATVSPPNSVEIWVAEGTYYPDDDEGSEHTDGSRTEHFLLKHYVAIYGGFAGNETSKSERNWETHVTVLSGDIDQDDGTGDPNGGNSYHVVRSASGAGSDTSLDGFTIERGYASGSWPDGGGAGFMNIGQQTSATFRNCLFQKNHSVAGAGAVYIHNENGGSNCEVTFEDCIFLSNDAGNGWGGAVYNSLRANTTFQRCRFLGNHADSHGGAVACAENTTQFMNCVFSGNTSDGRGGAVYLHASAWTSDTVASFVNCAFTENQADEDGGSTVNGGGAIYCEAASYAGYEGSQPLSLTVINSIIWDNVAPYPPGAGPYSDSRPVVEDDDDDAYDEITITVHHTEIEGGWTPGDGNFSGIPNFRDAIGVDAVWGTLDDDLRLGKNSPCFDRGDNAAGAGDYDLDGANRIMSTSCYGPGLSSDEDVLIDLGPYENQKFGIVYVDLTKTGGNNTGADWTNAFTDLHAALETAEDPEVCEVWVADGTYKPDDCTNCGSGDRDSTFEIPDHVGVYGGFEGTTDEVDRTEHRSPSTDVTTLTGLIGMTSMQRVYHVVTIPTGASSYTILDGFTVKNGKADGSADNKDRGGGALVKGNPVFQTCIFEYNKAKNGGAAYLYESAAQFIDCAIVNNDADDGAGEGSGGAFYVAGSHPNPIKLRRCNINNNESLGDGGAIYVADNSHWIQLTNCLFYQNEADKDDSGTEGGAIYTHEPIGLYNCTFARNQCGNDDDGGGIYLTHEYESSTIYNCIFWGNMTNAGSSPTTEADQIKFAAGTVTIEYTCVQYIDSLAGTGNNGLDPLFKNATSDDYELDPANCFFHSCSSKSIDLGEDDRCNTDTGCSDFDVKYRTRRVDLDQRDDDVDRGALETQSSP